MPVANWTPKAELDLEDILYYVRVTGGRPLTARRIGEEIVQTVDRQASLPASGSHHPLSPPTWRYVRHKRWLIFYQPQPTGIEVMRVIDAARDLPRVLSD